MATAELQRYRGDRDGVPDEPEGLYEIVGGNVVERLMGAAEGRIASRLRAHPRQLHGGGEGLGEAFVEVLFLTISETNW